MKLQKLLLSILGAVGLSLFIAPSAFASTGYISIPNQYSDRGDQYAGLLWTPSTYTNSYNKSPYLDPYHYETCSHSGQQLTGVLYNYSDNSVAASGMVSNVGCDGWMIIQYGDFGSNFLNNTPYYFIITDQNTGQTWQTPCFEDAGNDRQLNPCTNVNAYPYLQPFSNTSVPQGDTYSASGSFTDSDSTSWTATVDYGDGSGTQNLSLSGTSYTLSHQYNVQGTYIITVSVTDNQGDTVQDTARIVVAGSGTISIPNQYSDRGDQYAGLLWTPNGYTTNPYLDPTHYRQCSDGSPSFSGTLYNYNNNSIAASGMVSNVGCDGWMIHQFGDFGSNFQNNTPYYYVISDTNTGQTWKTPCFEDTGNDNQLVACPTNQAPTVNMLSNGSLNEGSAYSASGSFTDSDSTSWTATVDYGDGSGMQNLSLSGQNFSLSHQYKDEGTYIITVKVTDNQGATGTGNLTVTVNDVAPNVGTITYTPSLITVNSLASFSGPFTYGDSPDTAKWAWGDNNTTNGSVTESNGSGTVTNNHTYSSLGSFTIQLAVTNANNLTGFSQTVVGVIPTGGLIGGNLSHTNYSGANFSNQDLTKANLTVATFNNIDFSGANLDQVNGSNSSFTNDNFAGANFTKANFSNANFSGSNFTNANLKQANFSGTNITNVTWSNTICPDGTNSNNDGNTCVGHL